MTEQAQKLLSRILLVGGIICLLFGAYHLWRAETTKAEMQPLVDRASVLLTASLDDLRKLAKDPDIITSPFYSEEYREMQVRQQELKSLTEKIRPRMERYRRFETLGWSGAGVGALLLFACFFLRFIEQRKAPPADTLSLR